MSGLFYGLEIAKTALTVSQKAINVSGHNIANANTAGYTRQRVILESIVPASTDVRLSSVSKGNVGGGAEATLVDQIRNDYLDRQYRNQNTKLGYWQTRADEMEYIETAINELSDDTSISSAMADFFNSLSDLSENPSSEEIRTTVQQSALKMTETFNQYYDKLVEMQNSYNDAMKGTVDKINDLVTGIAKYNEQIYAYELSGEKANELRDKRNLMIDQLSELVNINATETNGEMVVSCNGIDLVNHTTATLLDARPELTGEVSGESGYYQIYLGSSSTVFSYSGGQLQAYKDLRDNTSMDNMGIPHILQSLNTLAQNIAKQFNAIHSTGYTMPNGSTASKTGVNLFEVSTAVDADGNAYEDYDAITAGNFTLSAEVLSSVYNIAASSKLIDLSAANTQEGNNEIALAMITLSSKTNLPTIGSFENYLKSTMVEVGTESSTCSKNAESQQTVLQNVEDRRQSISGVSLDEEMVQLVAFQHSYSAAARVLTAIDEALDVLINRTGRVGL
jgi:flagellar hook-associated protein 1 FlgK